MNIYSLISKAYDLLDVIYFSEKGKNPRKVIMKMISNKKIRILDMCCGTLSNTIDIAEYKPDIKIMGLDLSKDMLYAAREKIVSRNIKNIYLRCADAVNTGIQDKTFDCIIIGLVLHESNPELINGMLKEAYRLLKEDGCLIVLEWEKPKRYYQIIKFAPLYLLERLNCKTFKQFYQTEKRTFFMKHGFYAKQEIHCNYSVVLQLGKL